MPTNDPIELKICMDACFHPRNAKTLAQGGLKRHCVVKNDVRYHKIAQKFFQVVLKFQQIVELSCKFISSHIFHPRIIIVVVSDL